MGFKRQGDRVLFQASFTIQRGGFSVCRICLHEATKWKEPFGQVLASSLSLAEKMIIVWDQGNSIGVLHTNLAIEAAQKSYFDFDDRLNAVGYDF